MYARRLRKELMDLERSLPEGCSAAPKDQSNLYDWEAVITGPAGSPFENGLFFIDIQFPEQYPFRPPKMIFKTKIYHPNINQAGKICHQNLEDCWSPALKIWNLLEAIIQLLSDPELQYYIIEYQIGEMCKNKKAEYEKIAQIWTHKFAQ